jgi:hypothetical protein
MRLSSWRSIVVIAACATCAQPALLVASADAATAQTNTQPKKPSHRSVRQGMFALSQIDTASVVMLGDSLTEGAQWAEITGCYFVANRGIGGDDSAGVLRRLDEVLNLKPAAVFLMVGVNDVASSVPTDRIVDNVQQILERLTKSGARVYLALVLPVAQSFTRKINPKIDELNAAYIKLAKEAQVQLLDFRSETRNEDGFLRDDFSRDGIHLTAEGYRVWRDAVMPLVQKHCLPTRALEPQATAPKPGRVNSAPSVSGTPTVTRTPTASGTPSLNGATTTAPSGEFNTRFGPWR